MNIIYNKENMEKIGEVITNHSISLDDAIDLLGAVRLEKVNSDDPDFLIDGKEIWYDDLEMVNDDNYLKEITAFRLNKEALVKNGSGREVYSLNCVETETIAEFLRCRDDWGDLNEYVSELARRADINPDDYDGFDDLCKDITDKLGIDPIW